MNLKKIVASAVLSASLLTFGAADAVLDTQPVAQASAAENIIAGAIVGALLEAEYENRSYDNYGYGYDNYGYGYGYDNYGYGGYGCDYDYYEAEQERLSNQMIALEQARLYDEINQLEECKSYGHGYGYGY